MSGEATSRSRGAFAALLFVITALIAAPSIAANVDAIVVKFRGDEALAGVATLPEGHRFLVVKALRTGVAEIGRTRDGAYRLALEPALPFLEAQEAINRLRLDDQILYTHGTSRTAAEPRVRAQPKAGQPEPLLHRIIVKYRDPGLEQAAALNLPLGQGQLDRIAAFAGQPVAHERVMSGDAYLVRLFNRVSRQEAEAIADALEQDPNVEWAQPDYLDQIALVPNDPSYTSQWHYFDPVGGANLPAAWNRTTGSASIRVAVIDTGSLPNHPDLAGKFVGGYDFIIAASVVNPNDGNNRDPDPSDPGDWVAAFECGNNNASNSSWHGTHVAGTIAALTNNGIGVAGVNWASPIIPIRVLGKCGGFSSDIADGLAWASGGTVAGVPANANPAQVLNLSLGGYRPNATCDAVYQTAINGALSRNVVVVVAAGNTPGGEEAKWHTPANCNGVITVAANGRAGQRADYSNYDDNEIGGTIQVEISAPGGSDGWGVLSTLNSGTTSPNPSGYNYVNYQGTSMATPHVAGIVSLMLSVAPTKTPAQILAAITSTARAFPTGTGRDCTSNIAAVDLAPNFPKYCGAGIINADAAIAAVGSLPASTTTIASNPNPSVVGQNVTFTATVTGNAPTGTVAFNVNAVTIPGCGAVPLAGTGNLRTAQCATPNLAAGSYSIGAAYSGNGTNASSIATPATHGVLSLSTLGKQRDFDGNFKSDLLWKSNAGGSYMMWLMNGTTATLAAGIGLGTPWQVTHTADFSGDRRHDLLIRDSVGGSTVVWLMSGVGFTGFATLLADAQLDCDTYRRLRRRWQGRHHLAPRADRHDVDVVDERDVVRGWRDAAGRAGVAGGPRRRLRRQRQGRPRVAQCLDRRDRDLAHERRVVRKRCHRARLDGLGSDADRRLQRRRQDRPRVAQHVDRRDRAVADERPVYGGRLDRGLRPQLGSDQGRGPQWRRAVGPDLAPRADGRSKCLADERRRVRIRRHDHQCRQQCRRDR